MTETEQKKEYLKEYEKAVRQMKRSEEKITEMRLSKIMPSAGNDGMPHAHNNTDLSGYAALLDEEESQVPQNQVMQGNHGQDRAHG
mgnify:CR=1 FL=1